MAHTRDEIMAMDAKQLRRAIAEIREESVPDWPGSIQDAWALVEEMAKLENVEIANSDKGWCCITDDYARSIEGEATTAPLAISRAWLMWWEAQHE